MIKKLLNSAIILKLFVIMSVTPFANCGNGLEFLLKENTNFDLELSAWHLEVTTTAPSQNMTIQMDGPVDLTIDWGDAIEETTTLTSITHTYAATGVYVLKIRGQASRIYFNNPDAQALLTGFLSPLRGVDGIWNFTDTFQGCVNITTPIPAGFFDYYTGVIWFRRVFHNTGITGAISGNLFATNTQANDFNGVFWDCTGLSGSIPAGLFANNSQAYDFTYAFRGCTGLSGTLPAGLLANCPNAEVFIGTFSGCTNLTGAIPAGFFDSNTLVWTFASVFSDCTGITSIPAGLFDNNTLVTNFDNAFQNCTGIRSAVPPLWTTHTSASHTGCFNNVTNATNYADAVTNGWN